MLGTKLVIADRVSFAVVSDATTPRPQAQLELSICEFQSMKVMPGGVCVQNWMIMRGLLVPTSSDDDDGDETSSS